MLLFVVIVVVDVVVVAAVVDVLVVAVAVPDVFSTAQLNRN